MEVGRAEQGSEVDFVLTFGKIFDDVLFFVGGIGDEVVVVVAGDSFNCIENEYVVASAAGQDVGITAADNPVIICAAVDGVFSAFAVDRVAACTTKYNVVAAFVGLIAVVAVNGIGAVATINGVVAQIGVSDFVPRSQIDAAVIAVAVNRVAASVVSGNRCQCCGANGVIACAAVQGVSAVAAK